MLDYMHVFEGMHGYLIFCLVVNPFVPKFKQLSLLCMLFVTNLVYFGINHTLHGDSDQYLYNERVNAVL
jgi:hypothetical protein